MSSVISCSIVGAGAAWGLRSRRWRSWLRRARPTRSPASSRLLVPNAHGFGVVDASGLIAIDERTVRVDVKVGGLVCLDLRQGIDDATTDLEVAGALALLSPGWRVRGDLSQRSASSFSSRFRIPRSFPSRLLEAAQCCVPSREGRGYSGHRNLWTASQKGVTNLAAQVLDFAETRRTMRDIPTGNGDLLGS